MKVVCIQNFYGEGFDSVLEEELRKTNMPIFHKGVSYPFRQLNDYDIWIVNITKEEVDRNIHLKSEYTDLHENGTIDIHFLPSIFNKYFISVDDWREKQLNSLI